jgi:catechol 2,3-dioxygenase-like lactoylglutathione lyase family enzyme
MMISSTVRWLPTNPCIGAGSHAACQPGLNRRISGRAVHQPRLEAAFTAKSACWRDPPGTRSWTMASVRYIVDDVDKAVGFYRDVLGFSVGMHNPDKFAALEREDLQLLLNAPGAGSAGKAGGHPRPGGWSRFRIETDDLDGKIAELKQKGSSFRGDIAEAAAGRQILLEDPSGNVIEIFEPARRAQH